MRSKLELKIIKFGIYYLVKENFKSITMDDFAHNLHISKKTIYKYFPSKKNLVKNVIEFILEDLYNKYDKISKTTGHPIKKLWEMTFVFTSLNRIKNENILYIKNHYPKSNLLIVNYRSKFQIQFENVFADSIEYIENENFREPKILSLQFMNIIHHFYVSELKQLNTIPYKKLLMSFAEIYFKGLFGDKANYYKPKIK